MAGLGRKTFSPGDVLTSSDVQNYLMDQSVMVFAGTAARTSAIPSPSAGMVAYSTATQLQVYNGTAWVDASTGYGVATGGSATSIVVSTQNYTMLEFLTDANLVVSKAGLFDIFALGAGGGSGGNAASTDQNSGGGGGGNVLQTTIFLEVGTFSVDIGAGGAAGGTQAPGLDGFATTIGTIYYAVGGSGGGCGNGNAVATGVICGGGGNNNKTGGTTTAPNIGFNGGNGGANGAGNGAGGGAGTTAVGSVGTASVGGAPGAGISPSTFSGGTKTTTVGGGGGGARGSGSGGTGVDGGGSGASTNNGNGVAGSTNRGGGGGGSNGTGTSGAGSSGLCYIRFKV